MPNFALDEATKLGPEQLAHFIEHGYLILPGFLPPDLVARLTAEADHWVDEGLRAHSIACSLDPTRGIPSVVEVELPAHGELASHPPLLDVIGSLMGDEFVFHHMHSNRLDANPPAKPWHHDYEQNPQIDRAHMMIHTLHYLEGLDGTTAPLTVLPGSHREVAEKNAREHLGSAALPGELLIEELPAGSTVILHSALFHARRSTSGPGKPRYMIDASYCQVGPKWPPVKPYWRHILRRARELDLGRGLPELFAERHFQEYRSRT